MAYLDTHGLNTLWTKIKNTFVGEAPNDNKQYVRKNKTWEVIQGASGKEDVSNKVTTISDQSTDTQYPSAKCVYNAFADFTTMTAEVRNGVLYIQHEGRMPNGDSLEY